LVRGCSILFLLTPFADKIGMFCPFCKNEDTKVVDSRETNEGKITRRRRECLKCAARFSTYEEVELLKLLVLKRDGTKADYNKNKIEDGIRRALVKRPVSQERIAKLMGDIEYEIQSMEKPEVTTREIGRIVLKKLKDLDEVAYVRFASVYKSFASIESFKKELDSFDK
jgi:transcriptional repressor NrdR